MSITLELIYDRTKFFIFFLIFSAQYYKYSILTLGKVMVS